MQQAIDAGDYDVSSYSDINDPEDYNRIITQEMLTGWFWQSGTILLRLEKSKMAMEMVTKNSS